MIREYQDKEFSDFYDRNSGKTYSDMEFRNCHFVSCAISMTTKPTKRSTIKNVKLVRCKQTGCAIHPAVIDEVVIADFKTNGLFQAWGAVFRHTVLKGRIGRIMTSSWIAPVGIKPVDQKAFDEANARYYSNVDWALDIREALFQEADLRGIPARLILRDPETQFIITRERAQSSNWSKLDLTETHWKTAIELFLEDGAKDEVFVAPKQNPRFRILLNGLLALKEVGLFEDE